MCSADASDAKSFHPDHFVDVSPFAVTILNVGRWAVLPILGDPSVVENLFDKFSDGRAPLANSDFGKSVVVVTRNSATDDVFFEGFGHEIKKGMLEDV